MTCHTVAWLCSELQIITLVEHRRLSSAVTYHRNYTELYLKTWSYFTDILFEISVFSLKFPFAFFCRLFEGSSPRKIEKLKTLFCYFRTVTQTSKHYKIYLPHIMLQPLVLLNVLHVFQFVCLLCFFFKGQRVSWHSQDKHWTILHPGKSITIFYFLWTFAIHLTFRRAFPFKPL